MRGRYHRGHGMRRRTGGAAPRERRAAAARAHAAAAALALAVALASCGEAETPQATPASAVVPVPEATGPRDVAVLEVAELGSIHVELLEEVSPQSVATFRELVREGYYDGTTFHRVIPGFVVQGGDPNTRDRDPRDDGRGGGEEQIALERSDVSFVRGILAFANSGSGRSSGPQFFITLEDQPGLAGKYAVLGYVTEGFDVVDAIARVPVDMYGRHGPRDRPLEDVVLEALRIEEGTGGTARLAEGGADPAAAPAEDDPGSGASGEEEGDGNMASSDWNEGAP